MEGTTGYPNYCAPRVTPKIHNITASQLRFEDS